MCPFSWIDFGGFQPLLLDSHLAMLDLLAASLFCVNMAASLEPPVSLIKRILLTPHLDLDQMH